MKGLSKRSPIPLYVRICLVIGILSVTMLPLVILGMAWHRYKAESAVIQQKQATDRKLQELRGELLLP